MLIEGYQTYHNPDRYPAKNGRQLSGLGVGVLTVVTELAGFPKLALAEENVQRRPKFALRGLERLKCTF